MWPGQEGADSEPNWRLHRGPHDSGRPVTDEPLNRSWQRLVEQGAGAKQERLNRILFFLETRHLGTHLNLKTNDWKTNKRLTKGSFTASPSREAVFHRLFSKTHNDKTVLTQSCRYNVCFNVDKCWFIMLRTVGSVQNCNILGIDAVNRPLKVVPKHLNRIEVKTLTGPLQKRIFLCWRHFVVHLLQCFGLLSSCITKTSVKPQFVDIWTEKCPDNLDNNYFFPSVCTLIVCVLFIKPNMCIFVSLTSSIHQNLRVHILLPPAVYRPNESHNVGRDQRC